MYNSSPSFSIIVTCHNEQNYLINSLASVRNNIGFHLASFSEVSYEILLILDSPDVFTKSIAENWVKENEFGRIILTNNRDIGMSRNLGIKNAQFDLIFLLDGDDCWGLSWLKQSIIHFINNPTIAILHPELVLYKSLSIDAVRRHIETNDPDFDPWILSFENLWTSSIACPRSGFDLVTFPNGSTHPSNLFAYEDWSFFRESCEIGIPHFVIPRTVHLVNHRTNSNTTISYASRQYPWPSRLFYNLLKSVK